jgi:hypothetical protein
MNEYIFLFEIEIENKSEKLYRISRNNDLFNDEKIILQLITADSKIAEEEIVIFFMSIYKKTIINNSFYFEGNYIKMISNIFKINNFIKKEDKEDTNNIFFKIYYNQYDNEYIIKYLFNSKEEIIVFYKNNLIYNLINNKILLLDKPYNLNNDDFINEINKYKKNIDIDNFENIFYFYKFQKNNSVKDKINFLFSEWMINNIVPIKFHITELDNWYNFSIKKINLKYNYKYVENNDVNINIEILNIDNKYYEFNYIKKYLAYIIIFKKPDYFLLNCNYCKIGESNKFFNINNTDYKYINIFDSNDEPIKNKENLEKYIFNFKKILLDNRLINYRHNINPLFLEI